MKNKKAQPCQAHDMEWPNKEKEQSAVEFLAQHFGARIADGQMTISRSQFNYHIRLALQLEAKQRAFCYSHGWHDGQDVIINQVKHVYKGGDDAGEEFSKKYFNS